jgi:flagellar hook-associated protein 1 FlgK
MNDAAESGVRDLNDLARQVAQLNETIAIQESDGQTVASSLRDRRDSLLKQMAENADVTVRYLDNGTANVYVGSEPLVEYNRPRALELVRDIRDGFEVTKVRFEDNKSAAVFTSGKLAGIVNTRDAQVVGQIDQLDQLARGVIYEVNRIQSTGRGNVGLTSAEGTYAVVDSAAALNTAAAGLRFPLGNGTFIVNVRDTQTGQTITRQVEVDLDGLGTDTSLQDLAASLSAVPGLTASVTSDNRLSVQAAGGSEFWFTDDSSGALAALGVNAFFTGTSAQNIAIDAAVRNDPRLIATGQSAALGDGSNAALFGQLGAESSTQFDGLSAVDFHARLVNQLAVETAAANTAYEASDAVQQSLQAQRESISGVSLDEEALNLTMYQRSFQGASRFLNVIQNLSEELLSLLR